METILFFYHSNKSLRYSRWQRKSITNLINHLKSHHRHEELLKEYEAADSFAPSKKMGVVVPIQQAIENCRKFINPKAKIITDTIMAFIALDNQPFSVVEGQGFCYLIAHMKSRYTLPAQTFIV